MLSLPLVTLGAPPAVTAAVTDARVWLLSSLKDKFEVAYYLSIASLLVVLVVVAAKATPAADLGGGDASPPTKLRLSLL